MTAPADKGLEAFSRAIATFSPPLPLAVAFSGGADSSALLMACAEKWPSRVYALHVHHGLQAAGDDFERHCRDICARHSIPLAVGHIQAHHAPGESPQNAARIARYKALQQLLAGLQEPVSSIAIAQHADDQVETLLLALSRGAGLPGLAAMPAHWQRDGVNFFRPLLDVPASALRAWLRQRNLPWVEDPSNASLHYTRNRIRALVMPALEQAFPQFRQTFARSARHAAQAQELMHALALEDLKKTGSPPAIRALQGMSAARQANVLRVWLRDACHTTPSAAQLQELLAQIADCTTRGHRIHIMAGSGFVRRCGDHLDWYNPQALAHD